MVHQVRVDGILQVTAPVVGQQDVDRFGARVGFVLCGDDGVVDGVDYVGVRREEGVGFYFFEGEGDGFLAEGASDFFEGVEG